MSAKPAKKGVKLMDIIHEPENQLFMKWCDEKSRKLKAVGKKTAFRFYARLFTTYLPKWMWEEVRSNKKKMELVWKVWKDDLHFFGMGPDLPEKVIEKFVNMAHEALVTFNEKSDASRKKHRDSKTPIIVDLLSDDEGAEEYSRGRVLDAKLANVRTARKSVVPARNKRPAQMTNNPYKKKKTTNSADVRRVSYM